jgi:hypothetical protein
MEGIMRLCDVVRETGFAVHRYHRHGHMEKVYESALAHWFRKLDRIEEVSRPSGFIGGVLSPFASLAFSRLVRFHFPNMRSATRPQYHRLQRIHGSLRRPCPGGPRNLAEGRACHQSERAAARALPAIRWRHSRLSAGALHLVAYHGNWHLLALNTTAGRIETFALSRCRSLAGTGQHFAHPPGFHAPEK